ncbi:MAG: CHASE3 domain-containing protein, partial [Sediminibacterium sp.]
MPIFSLGITMKKQNAPIVSKTDSKIGWIFAFSLVALVIFISVLYKYKNHQEDTRLWVTHAGVIITNIDTVSILFSETETATRSFFITQTENWKNVTLGMHKSMEVALSKLVLLTVDNPAQQVNVEKLRSLWNRKKVFQDSLVSGMFTTPSLLVNRLNPSGDGPQLTREVKSLLVVMR